MNNLVLKTFQRLPSPLKALVATYHGTRLRRWRYGTRFRDSLEAAHAREFWTWEQWEGYQRKRLRDVCRRARERVPFYRERWRNAVPEDMSPESLAQLPIVEKETVRSRPYDFVADDCDLRAMYREHTSGTTGTPLDVWWSHDTVQDWYSLFEARWREWNGLSRHDRWAILGGQVIVPIGRSRPPFWVHNSGLNQLYMSVYHISLDSTPAYLDAIAKYRPVYMFGFASAMHALAAFAIEHRRDDVRFRVAISNAEPLHEYQRETITRAFGCPVRNTYAMSEIAVGAGECPFGTMHVWPDAGIVEVVDRLDRPLPPGRVGDLVCTGLVNPDMPFIRYRVGDRGALAPRGTRCPCGRQTPVLASLEGRNDDVLWTSDGRSVGRLGVSGILDGLRVREVQFVQDSLQMLRVRYVPTEGFSGSDEAALGERVRQRLAGVQVVLQRESEIERTQAGKLRTVVSNLSRDTLPFAHLQFSGQNGTEAGCVCVSTMEGVSRRL